MSALARKLSLYAWGAGRTLRLGRPDVSLGFLGGIGDDLLCTAAIDEWLRRGARRIWFFTRHPGLYPHYRGRVQLVPEDGRYARLAQLLGRPMRSLSYSTYDAGLDRDTPLREHILADMCRRAGLAGTVRLRPSLSLFPAELAGAEPWADSIVFQTSSLTASIPMKTKQWSADRMQAGVDAYSGSWRCAQIGSPADPPLRGADDLRGKTSLRQSAAVLGRARLFVGTVGFLMHLARAVDCPAVVVYGGREPPEFTGYPCNHNVDCRPACSPCWQRNRCDFGHVCMEDISANRVIESVARMLDRPRGPLAVQEATL